MGRNHPGGAVAAADVAVAGQVAGIMRALGTRSRVQILGRLAAGSCTVGELVSALGMEQSAVSHQLALLRHLGLVVGERRGRQVVYALHDPHIADLLREAVSHADHRRRGLREEAAEAMPEAAA